MSILRLKLQLLSILVFVLTSCSFNKLFLKPDKYPQALNTIRIITPEDTLVAYFSGQDHQPTFTKRNGRDTVKMNYTIESVMFKSSNGDTLNGWLLKPVNSSPKITLLHLHGNGGSLFTHYKLMSPLLKHNFQIFLFDYSGFGFSTGKATRENSLTNARSAVDYILSRKDVIDTKVVIYGQSYGGHLAAVVAEEKQKVIDGLVIEGAFSSPKDIAARKLPVLGRILVKQTYSANRSIRSYQKPLLVIHSVDDNVIPIYMGRKLFNSANSSKEFYEITKCHVCGPHYYTNEISDKIITMIR